MVSAGQEPLPLDVAPDSRVLLFTLLLSLATPLLFGLAPAWRAARVELNASLKQGRNIAAVNSPLARALVVGQVALSLVLLVGAGLFLRTLVNLINVDMGFDKHNVLVFGIEPASVGYKEDSRLTRLYEEIELRVSAIPGVRAASFSFFTFNQGAWSEDAWTPEESPEAKGNREVVYNKIGTKAPMSSGRTGYVAATLDLTITLSESRKLSGAKNGDGGSLGAINEFDGQQWRSISIS